MNALKLIQQHREELLVEARVHTIDTLLDWFVRKHYDELDEYSLMNLGVVRKQIAVLWHDAHPQHHG